jgi:hypothetical protein
MLSENPISEWSIEGHIHHERRHVYDGETEARLYFLTAYEIDTSISDAAGKTGNAANVQEHIQRHAKQP